MVPSWAEDEPVDASMEPSLEATGLELSQAVSGRREAPTSAMALRFKNLRRETFGDGRDMRMSAGDDRTDVPADGPPGTKLTQSQQIEPSSAM